MHKHLQYKTWHPQRSWITWKNASRSKHTWKIMWQVHLQRKYMEVPSELEYSWPTTVVKQRHIVVVLWITSDENKILREVGSCVLQTVKAFVAMHNPASYSIWIIYLHYFTHLEVGLAFELFPILLVEFAVVQLIQLPRWNQNSLCQEAKINVNNKLHCISFPHGHTIQTSEHCPHKNKSIVSIRQIFHTL